MTICLCTSWYFPNSVGGTETYVQSLAIFLKKQGYKVYVLKPGQKNEPDYSFNGIDVCSYYPGNHFSRPMYFGLEPPALDDFEKKLKQLKPDLVHFHSLSGPTGITLFHIQMARQYAAKVFFTFHLPHLTCATSNFKYLQKQDCEGVSEPHKCAVCILQQQGWPVPAAKVAGAFSSLLHKRNVKLLGNSPILTRLGTSEWIDLRKVQLKMLSNTCDKVICLASWFYDVLIKNGVRASQVAFIEQGLLMNKTAFTPKSKSLDSSMPIKLVFLGRLNPIKGLSLLLSAMQKFEETDFTLDLYGPAEEAYLTQIQSLLARKNICYKGLLPHDEVLPTLSQYDAMVAPSLVTEMAPLVLQEAFAAGIPVIASDVPGNAAFIKPGINGWLFKSGNHEALVDLFLWLLEHKDELAGISNKVTPGATMNDIGNRHLELYISP